MGKSLGLSKYQRLRRIGIPIIRPSVIAGVSFVIMETLAEYATMEYFGVPATVRVSFAVYNNFSEIDILFDAIDKVTGLFS